MTGQSIKQRLAQGQRQLGFIMLLPSADVAEIIGLSGVDVVMIDHEHGTGSLQDFVAQARALQGSQTLAMVRIPGHDPAYMHRLLDAGARALVCPGIDTADDAEAFVRACRYPPRGVRGAGAGARAARYGADSVYYGRELEDDLLLVAQIESARAVENIDAICAVPGIDMLLIGPRDLSASIGALNQFDNPELWRLVDRAAERIKASGKHLACTLRPGKTVSEMFAEGYDLVLTGKDVDFLLGGAKAMVAAAKAG